MSRWNRLLRLSLVFCITAGQSLFPTFTGTTVMAGHCASTYCAPLVQQQIVYKDRIVYTPQVQQYVAVPVQPYYVSWNQMYGQTVQQQPGVAAAPTPNGRPPAPTQESAYLTREEFVAAMQDIVAAIRNGEGGHPAPLTGGIPREVSTIIRQHCATCHDAKNPPKATWQTGLFEGNPVVLWDRDRPADNIDWDRVAIVSLTGKMPKEGKLSAEEINELVHHAATYKNPKNGNGRPAAPPPAPEPVDPPPSDTNY